MRRRRLLLGAGVLIPFAALQGLGASATTAEVGVPALVRALRTDPDQQAHWRALSVNNSHVIIESPAIRRVVAAGPKALRPLVAEMRRAGVTLDTFTRCYSACDQILEKAGLKHSVRWHGGHITVRGRGDRVVRTSRIDGFSEAFRREQVREIIRRANEAGIALKDMPK